MVRSDIVGERVALRQILRDDARLPRQSRRRVGSRFTPTLEGLRPIAPIAGGRRQLDRARTEAARQVNELNPDIPVLNEALYSRQYRGYIVDYARLFGFPYQSAALYDDAWGNAVLSRCPILRSHEMRTKERGG